MSKEKSWEKRLSSGPDKLTIDFVESLSYDRRLYEFDIEGSIAHAAMLADRKIISNVEFKSIESGLLAIKEDIANGKFTFDKTQEDIHMAIEAALIERIGEPGKKLHTGRSRNDQIATDIRLWMRYAAGQLQTKLTATQKALAELAALYCEDIMPGYTHMQRAQPVAIGAYILSFVEQFDRDYQRIGNCLDIFNISPLGSGALAGSTIPLDRNLTAEKLGFAGATRNSIDSVGDRDFCAEFIFDCSMIAVHLSRLAEDWIIYCSSEFGFIKIADAFCTSSSMMPQKRNPDLLELIRGKTGSIYGSLVAMLTILKGLPTGYNRDLQEDKLHVFSAFDNVCASLDVACAIIQNTEFKVSNIISNLDEGFLDATSLAEYLVNKGIPFRQAHGIVGCAVAECELSGKKLAELSHDDFKEFSDKIESDVYDHLTAANVVKRYVTNGAAGPKQVKEQIDFWKMRLASR